MQAFPGKVKNQFLVKTIIIFLTKKPGARFKKKRKKKSNYIGLQIKPRKSFVKFVCFGIKKQKSTQQKRWQRTHFVFLWQKKNLSSWIHFVDFSSSHFRRKKNVWPPFLIILLLLDKNYVWFYFIYFFYIVYEISFMYLFCTICTLKKKSLLCLSLKCSPRQKRQAK